MAVLKLKLLGGFELEGADRQRLPTRKAEALLAYLVMPAGRTHSREKLASLLWGDRGDVKARHCLAQTLHLVRKTLGANSINPLRADSRTIAVDESSVDVDVATFEKFAAQKTKDALAQAASLYKGDFLGGMHVREVAFESWLLGEQRRLHNMAENALEALLQQQFDKDEDDAAAETALQLLNLDPTNESVHRTLMRIYYRADRREAAIRQYLSCAEHLSRELGIEPDKKTTSLYREISNNLIACRRLAEAKGNPSEDVSIPHSAKDRPSIAVLPFANLSRDPDQEFFADGIVEDVITVLSRFPSLFVIARSSTFTYKDHVIDITQVARELGVRYVVEGSVRKAGNRVLITARLIDAASGNHLWADRFNGSLDDVFELQDQITEQIVIGVEPAIHLRERERARRMSPDSLDAWELLQRGLSHLYRVNRSDRTEAIRLFREAIKLDPEFAAAHAHLAYAIWASRSVTLGHAENSARSAALARAAAERAISLDPNEPMAHFALGRLQGYTGEAEMAISEMRTAIAINPNFDRGHHGLGWAYYYAAGQVEEALPHLDTAVRLSPRSPLRWLPLMIKGSALSILNLHDEAIAYCRQACQLPDSGFLPYTRLAAALAEAGQRGEARRVVEKAMLLQPALSISFLRNQFTSMHKATSKSLFVGLRKAGVPE